MSLLGTHLAPLTTPIQAAWLHTLDPFVVEFPEAFPIPGLRWYGTAYLLGFVAGYFLIRRVVTAGKSPLTSDRVIDFVIACIFGVLVGGRLGYVMFYDPSLWERIDEPPYWGVLAINRGGMASHGGMIGGLLGCAWFAYRQKLPRLHLLDLLAFACPAGLFFGRIANFINGELWGRTVDASFALAVRFPQETLTGPELSRLRAGDSEMIALAEQLTPARHPSQLYAAALEGLAVFAALLWFYRKPVKPGVLAAWFALSYAPMRIVNEFFREPDTRIGFDALGLTRGQWLSVVLFVAGLILLRFATTRPVEPLGGWWRAE
ncbi:MAG: prolipoprotein diacylglyceryl transferase [Planctomycetota bacterium]